MPMRTYLLIGLGGALGSVARAWLALAVARATGPQFPWGTILINIAGSFVIGGFATLTATDPRFAVPADARAFVMIGLCGGFTTFSAFSLQTLDLLRDGRPLQALGNVGLSVALCLVAVAAGHYGAVAIAGGRGAVRPAAAAADGAVLVVLERPEAVAGLLEAAERLTRAGLGQGVRALLAPAPPLPGLLASEEVMTGERTAELRAAREDWAGALHAAVDRWVAAAPGRAPDRAPDRVIDRATVLDEPGPLVAGHARGAAALVVATPAPGAAAWARQALHAALFDTAGPVLAVPRQAGPELGRVVAIAWRDDPGAAAAVRAALPILAGAEQVHVLGAGGVPPGLAEAGIRAERHMVDDDGGHALLDRARALGADLIVMGAYTHGPWREAMLGGVTRHLLDHADLPLLMAHAAATG